MTFVFVSALFIALLVAAPVAAHLLRRGRRDAVRFPLVRLVAPTPKMASKRGRLQDKLLFSVRTALIVTLALLGAVPLVRCDHPVLTRQQGASVALAVVLDDSGSMRTQLNDGSERFEKAKRHALQLIDQLHEGDFVSLVLAGKPARLLAGATPARRMVREMCAKVTASDRGTDLSGAMQMADNSLRSLPHTDRRIVVFSDLSQPLPKVTAQLWLPLPELAVPAHDCGITLATRQDTQVKVEVACSNDVAQRSRHVVLVKRGARATPKETLVAKELSTGPRLQSLTFDSVPGDQELDSRLDGTDQNSHNDVLPVFVGTTGTVTATLTDYTTSRAATGGPPLIEQALAAFGGDITLRPWTVLPEDEAGYNGLSLLVLDDPGPLGPEVRVALENWVNRGGTAVAWLGPRAMGNALGASLSPFLEGNAVWETKPTDGFDPESVKWLGAAGVSMGDIHPKGRLAMDSALPTASNVRARWTDSRVSVLERNLGKGAVWTVGIPISSDQSDVALRPGFLAFLEHVIEQTRKRGLSPVTTVGHAWRFDRNEPVTIRDPDGNTVNFHSQWGYDGAEKTYTPLTAGLYTLTLKNRFETRLAHEEPPEIIDLPIPPTSASATPAEQPRPRLDLSPQLTCVLAVLVLFELALSSRYRRTTSA